METWLESIRGRGRTESHRSCDTDGETESVPRKPLNKKVESLMVPRGQEDETSRKGRGNFLRLLPVCPRTVWCQLRITLCPILRFHRTFWWCFLKGQVLQKFAHATVY